MTGVCQMAPGSQGLPCPCRLCMLTPVSLSLCLLLLPRVWFDRAWPCFHVCVQFAPTILYENTLNYSIGPLFPVAVVPLSWPMRRQVVPNRHRPPARGWGLHGRCGLGGRRKLQSALISLNTALCFLSPSSFFSPQCMASLHIKACHVLLLLISPSLCPVPLLRVICSLFPPLPTIGTFSFPLISAHACTAM